MLLRFIPLMLFISMAQAAPQIGLTVVDVENGQPIPNAFIALSLPESREPTPLATNSEGFCALPLPDAPRYIAVHVYKDGWVPKLINWNLENPAFKLPETFTLKMEKARTIGGIVVDEAGKPIPGVTLRLIIRYSSGGRPQEVHDDLWEKRVTTNKEGKWTFDKAPSSLKPMSISLSHEAYVSAVSALPSDEEFFAKTAKLTMKAGNAIEGVIRDEKGKPIADVAVLLGEHGAGSTTMPSYASDKEGVFRIANAPQTGEILLTFFKKGYAPELLELRSNSPKQNIVLKPGNKLTGKVVDVDGKPIPGAMLGPDHWRGHRPFAMRFLTDAEGKFNWDDAPVDNVVFDVLQLGYAANRGVVMKAGEPNVVTMRRPLAVQARVVDAASGKPIPAFTVTCGNIWSGRRYNHGDKIEGKDGVFEWKFDEPSARSNVDGSLGEEGSHFLQVTAPGYVPLDSRPLLDKEKSPIQLEFALKKGSETKLRLVSKQGEAVKNAVLAISGGDTIFIRDGALERSRGFETFESNQEGEVVLPPLQGNPTLVVVHPTGFALIGFKEALAAKQIGLTGWGKVEVTGPPTKPNEGYLLRYEDLERSSDTSSVIAIFDSTPKRVNDNTVLFEGAKPGKALIGQYNIAMDMAEEVVIPENGMAKITMKDHRGKVTVLVKLNVPEDFGEVDWSKVHGNFYQKPKEPIWPKGLTYQERRAWIESAEGKKAMPHSRGHSVKVQADGTAQITGVHGGRYYLSVILSSSEPNSKLRGIFETLVDVPSDEELAKIVGEVEDGGHSILSLKIEPPFFRPLAKGAALPEFAAISLEGKEISSASLAGKKSLLVFWKSYPFKAEELAQEFRKATETGVPFVAFSSDDEKTIAERFVADHRLTGTFGWIGDEDVTWREKFGGMTGIVVYAVGPDGKILGMSHSIMEALATFE